MRLAFQKVCEALELDCKPGDPMTELVVTKIIEHAKAGEIDPDGRWHSSPAVLAGARRA